MTLNALAKEMAARLGEDEFDPDVVDQFERWAKDGYREVHYESRDWPFVIGSEPLSLSSGSHTYTISTSASEVKAIQSDSRHKQLTQVTEDYLTSRGFDLSQTGDTYLYFPIGWDKTEQKQKIRVWPVPDDNETFTVFRTAVAEALTSTTEIPVPDMILDLIRLHVKSSYYDDIDNDQTATRLYRRFRVRMRDILGRLTSGQDKIYRPTNTDVPRSSTAPPEPTLGSSYPADY